MGPSDQPHTGCPKKNAPIKQTKMAKHGRLVNIPKWCQRSPKGSEMANLDVFDHLGPVWARLDPFGPFQTKNDFLIKPYFVLLGQQTDLFLEWSKSIQMGPQGSQIAKNI